MRSVNCYGCGLDGPGIESRWGARFSFRPDRPWSPPSLLHNGHRVFPGAKSGRGVTLTPHPFLVPRSRNSIAIPLLPLWAVRPVQSLTACTRGHFTFFYLYLVIKLYRPTQNGKKVYALFGGRTSDMCLSVETLQLIWL